jgi:hypothetical protein
MKPTPEIEARGLKAYEQVRAFERLRGWRLPVSYAIFVAIPLVFGWVALRSGYEGMGEFQFGVAFLFAVIAVFQWKHLKERHVRNLALVADLERTYGDELPWVQVNNHFAALEKLQREIAEEKAAGTDRATGPG